jgi:hypothetical protein
MNRQKTSLFLIALVLIGGTAFGMRRLQSAQKLGAPGIRTSAIPGSMRRHIEMPAQVLDYHENPLAIDTNFMLYMPQDTSISQSAFWPEIPGKTNTIFDRMILTAVMMGTDRTSIHKPQFCLTGQGWTINDSESGLDTVRVGGAKPYDLEVMKLLSTREFDGENGKIKYRAVYIYWFVADHDMTARHGVRMWRSAVHLLKTGELERWAYVSCFAVCLPGQEEETAERVKKFISAAVPELQTSGVEP